VEQSASGRFLVLVTGLAAAGKTTVAPVLAERLAALWISRDRIHEMVYSGWEPTRTSVVADTPFNHDWNRSMFREAAADIEVPMVEVALQGAPDVLRERAVLRAASGDVHEIKAKFSVNGPDYYARVTPAT
jgi:predicted kinase